MMCEIDSSSSICAIVQARIDICTVIIKTEHYND
jgi:hypothetical protein